MRPLVFLLIGLLSSTAPPETIEDAPAYPRRMMLLDCARHYFTTEEVKQVLDLLALHRINTFHWHLTDDQGWRIQIHSHPRLTEGGPFYSQEEIREIVEYASRRQIMVIPEIEMPGHASAALAAYPFLGCKGEGYGLKEGMGVWDDVFCPGKESSFAFLEDVLDEVMELFPSPYIHIGGDECRKSAWEQCPECNSRMQAEHLADVQALQTWMMRRMAEYLQSKGRTAMAWDEVGYPEEKVPVVLTCRYSDERLQNALEKGYPVILCPAYYCYFDYYQHPDHEHEPKAHVGANPNLDLETAYSFSPSALYPDARKEQVLGVECCLWTEYISTFDHLMYMLMPRLAAFAEVAWNGKGDDYQVFLERLNGQTQFH